jgi:hypothetical protein
MLDPEHPITWQLAAASALAESSPDETDNSAHQLYFNGARPIQLDPALQEFITPLIFVRQNHIYGESDYDGYVSSGGVVEYNIGTDSARGNLILAVAVEDPASGGRLVLVGDVDLLKNGTGFASSPDYSQGFIYPANVQFIVNATNWMLEASAPMPSFPTAAATSTVTITPSPTMTNTPKPATATPTPAA